MSYVGGADRDYGSKFTMPKKLKLMVVDDESNNLDLLYRTFRRQFQVFRADNAAQGLEILDAEGEMAVIISDQSMPEMTGIEFFSKISVRFPDTIRILLTGYSEDQIEDEVEGIELANIFKCITKPFSPKDLQSIVEESVEIYSNSKPQNDDSPV